MGDRFHINSLPRTPAMDIPEDSGETIVDPAEYLFNNTKYHDFHFVVGNPNTDQVERIGVVTLHLVAHSNVFRDMLDDGVLAEPEHENTHITDVSPTVFKLMLRHVYGGELPNVSRKMAAELLVCARKYNIQELMSRASVLLIPTTVKELFLALHCVVYISLPKLEPHVAAMVQQLTCEIVNTNEFLNLDGNCLEFIAKQDKLAITELNLWRSLVMWAENQAADNDVDLRQFLDRPLRHVRLLTLSHKEIVEEVMDTDILSETEFLDLLSAVVNNESLQSSKLCNNREMRYSGMSVVYKKLVFCFGHSRNYTDPTSDYETSSSLTIKTGSVDVHLVFFICESRSLTKVEKDPLYNLNCSISVHKFIDGICNETEVVTVRSQAISGERIRISLKLKNDQLLRLKANSSYNFHLKFELAHPVYHIPTLNTLAQVSMNSCEYFRTNFLNAQHVQEISYFID